MYLLWLGEVWTSCGTLSFLFKDDPTPLACSSSSSYMYDPRLCTNRFLQRWDGQAYSLWTPCLVSRQTAQELLLSWGILPPCPGSCPCPCKSVSDHQRSAMDLCPALISLQHVSEESSPLEYKGCHMNHFVQHVLSMHVFGVVSDIKQDSWNSHVYSEICERLCPQQS